VALVADVAVTVETTVAVVVDTVLFAEVCNVDDVVLVPLHPPLAALLDLAVCRSTPTMLIQSHQPYTP